MAATIIPATKSSNEATQQNSFKIMAKNKANTQTMSTKERNVIGTSPYSFFLIPPTYSNHDTVCKKE